MKENVRVMGWQTFLDLTVRRNEGKCKGDEMANIEWEALSSKLKNLESVGDQSDGKDMRRRWWLHYRYIRHTLVVFNYLKTKWSLLMVSKWPILTWNESFSDRRTQNNYEECLSVTSPDQLLRYVNKWRSSGPDPLGAIHA